MVGVNCMVGEYTLTINPDKVHACKRYINHVDRPRDMYSSGKKCMFRGPRQTLKRSLKHYNLDNTFILKTKNPYI